MSKLHEKWFCDQKSALGAAILAGTDLATATGDERAKLVRATQVIAANAINENVGFLADSTLALLEKIPDAYREPDPELLGQAMSLSDVISAAQSEIGLRKDKSRRMSAILIAHAVYLLKQAHLSIRDFVKWLERCDEPETCGMPRTAPSNPVSAIQAAPVSARALERRRRRTFRPTGNIADDTSGGPKHGAGGRESAGEIAAHVHCVAAGYGKRTKGRA